MYTLLGDPALRLNLPPLTIQIQPTDVSVVNPSQLLTAANSSQAEVVFLIKMAPISAEAGSTYDQRLSCKSESSSQRSKGLRMESAARRCWLLSVSVSNYSFSSEIARSGDQSAGSNRTLVANYALG